MPDSLGLTAIRRRLLVIRNPTAGGWQARRFAALRRELTALGCEVAEKATLARGDAETFAREASAADFDAVIAAGGDGTINEVANGLAANGSGLPLGIVPLGTANVLAHEIDMPIEPRAMASALVRGPAIRVYPGRVGKRLFLQMAGIGFDAHVVARADLGIKRRLGKAAYVLAMLGVMTGFGGSSYHVLIDGREFVAASVIVSKVRYYAGRHLLAPDARLDQPVFQVCLLGKSGFFHVARYLAALVGGRLHRLPDVHILPASRVMIDGPHFEPVQADGDLVDVLPLRLEIATYPLYLIHPTG